MNIRYTFFTYSNLITFLYVNTSSDINLDSSDFETLVASPTFVDKTLMIKSLLENDNFNLITAPPKFGKSSILNMVKTFMELQVTYHGLPTTKTNYLEDHINDTENYRLFLNNSLKITNYHELFAEHFGKTPIITVDFKAGLTDSVLLVECLYDVIRICKEVVHNSIRQHKYLKLSARLTEYHRQYVRMWADQHSYKSMVDSLYVSHGLQSLAQYLHQHFGTRVFVLIDNYDFLLRHIVRQTREKAEALRMVHYVTTIIRDVVNDNNEHVRGALITGVSVLPFLNYSDFNDCRMYNFLGNHEYNDFYGLTNEEVEGLLEKHEISSRLGRTGTKVDCELFGGYLSQTGRHVYNMYSFMKFLESGKTEHYFISSGAHEQLINILYTKLVENELTRLLQGETVQIKYPLEISVVDIINLHNMTDKLKVTSYILLNLIDWGLLTFDSVENTTSKETNLLKVKIPNSEAKQFLLDYFKKTKDV